MAEELFHPCDRLRRETNACAVFVLDGAGDLLGHAGPVGRLPDPAIELIGDLAADLIAEAERSAPPADDRIGMVDRLRACAASLGPSAVLAVVFDERSNLPLVRAGMRRVREQLLRTLEG